MTPSFYREKGAANTKPSLCFALISILTWDPPGSQSWEVGGQVKWLWRTHPSPQPQVLSLKGGPRAWTGVSLGQGSLPCSQHHTLGPSVVVHRIFGFHLLGGKRKGVNSPEIGPRTAKFAAGGSSSNTLTPAPGETVAWCR